MDLAGQEVLIVGLAKTGTAVARFLLQRGSRVTIVDDQGPDRLKPRIDQVMAAAGDPSRVKLYLAGTFAQPSGNPALLVLSPGVPVTHPAVTAAARAGVPVISEIELASRFLKGRIAGITGSNGKTTCTALLGAILSRRFTASVSGNIGRPLIECVESDHEGVWHAVELSSYQLETIEEFRPDIALLLNITPDHMDRYGTMDSYAAAKRRIFMNQGADQVAVLNARDPRVSAISRDLRSRVVWFGGPPAGRERVYVLEEKIRAETREFQGNVMALGEIPLRGAHNVENVMACVTAGLAAGVEPHDIASAVRQFRPVEHRLEYVDTIRDVQFYNDSKATNVDAAVKAIEAFHEPLVLIAGGRDKDADFSGLARTASQRVSHMVLIGEAAGKIAQALGSEVEWSGAAGMRQAVESAFARSRPGQVVLLAPACASFDMFRDYEHRGETFKAEVRRLKEATT